MHYLYSIGFGVHNIYILLLGEAGIIPFLMYFLFLFYLFWIGINEKKFSFQFLIFGTVVVFFFQLSMSAHYLLTDKASIGFLMLLIAMIALRKRKLLEI
jgi:O-antigen ligase